MELKFDSRSENEAFARQAVCAFVAGLDPTLEELGDLRIVVSEAVTNCVVHAYKGNVGEVSLSVKCYSDRSVKIKIKDKGCGISDLQKCMEPLYTTDSSGERGGMGFAIMNSLSDKLTVKSEEGKGTTLYIHKRLK